MGLEDLGTIVDEGFRGKPLAAICQDDQISQAQSDQGRDQFLTHAHKPVEAAPQTEREAQLHQEQARLNKLVGELTFELKKNDEEVWP